MEVLDKIISSFLLCLLIRCLGIPPHFSTNVTKMNNISGFFFMLNSAEHEIFPTQLSMKFFLLINDEMFAF